MLLKETCAENGLEAHPAQPKLKERSPATPGRLPVTPAALDGAAVAAAVAAAAGGGGGGGGGGGDGGGLRACGGGSHIHTYGKVLRPWLLGYHPPSAHYGFSKG